MTNSRIVAGNFPVDQNWPLPITSSTQIMKVDEASATITYIGIATAGTPASANGWQIKRIDTSAIAADILFADGNVNYDNVWNSRAGLSYS